MKKIAMLALVLLGTLTNAASAAWTTNIIKITQIEIDGTTAVSSGTSTYLVFDVLPSARTTCTGSTSNWALLTGTAENVKAMTQLATAAQLSGRPVAVYWDGTCDGIYPKIKHLRMN